MTGDAAGGGEDRGGDIASLAEHREDLVGAALVGGEGLQAGPLHEGVGAGFDIRVQPDDYVDHVLGTDRRAQAPTAHRVPLREGKEDHAAVHHFGQ